MSPAPGQPWPPSTPASPGTLPTQPAAKTYTPNPRPAFSSSGPPLILTPNSMSSLRFFRGPPDTGPDSVSSLWDLRGLLLPRWRQLCRQPLALLMLVSAAVIRVCVDPLVSGEGVGHPRGRGRYPARRHCCGMPHARQHRPGGTSSRGLACYHQG